MINQEMISIKKLKLSPERDIRENIVDEIKGKISKYGYVKTKAFAVQKNNNDYLVKGGNHRLRALIDLEIDDDFLCLVYPDDEDPKKIAFEDNRSEDVIGQEDLFDWLGYIQAWRISGLKQQKIANRMGLSIDQISLYEKVYKNNSTEILNYAKKHQKGRVENKSTSVEFDFTEGWFRNSGLYDIAIKDKDKKIIPLKFKWIGTTKDESGNDKKDHVIEEYDFQMEFMEWFIEKKRCKAPKSMIDEQIKSYKEKIEQLMILDADLSIEIDNYTGERKKLTEAILKSEYSTDRFKGVIEKLNESAQSRALFGVDALDELRKMKDGRIDCVVTDPPWGVNFRPSRETENPNFDENIAETIIFLEEAIIEIKRVMKDNAHMYMFFPTMHYHEFKTMLDKYFNVEPIPIVWVKNNHNPCNFKKRYASKYETIFFCKMAKGDERELNYDFSPDVLIFNKPTEKYHDCQKPIDLLMYLIENSTGEKETVLDPFAGSGSTLHAAAKASRFYIGFEKDKEYEPKFKRLLGEIVSE